jgi:hypothetical protein
MAIYDVVRTASGHGLEQVCPGKLEVGSVQHNYWFHGLTTDGTYLYATALVHREDDPKQVDQGALFRILPKKNAPQVAIAH